ncbi:hypothetical protein FB451DRAFT_1077509 [Mycena latifolia]|nr:hypothetical protein FB451DRAFT_1077509 [Mycena latifolia]
MATLQFSTEYWEKNLPGIQKLGPEAKLHLILSLVIFLGVSIRPLLVFIFESPIQAVSDRASRFLGYSPSADDPHMQFPPSHIFSIWTERCTSAAQHNQMREMITPLAHAIVLEESDNIIKDPLLQIRLKDLTIARMRELIQPGMLADKYQDSAPFLYGLLQTFSASPNRYRREKQQREERQKADESESGSDSSSVHESNEARDPDWEDDPDIEFDEAGAAESTPEWESFEGFSRNPVFATILAISMLAFVRNRATNLLPLLLGLFFKISGISTRVLRMLSNTGVSVSGRTVERLKIQISDDAIQQAIALVLSGTMFCTLFNNINIYLRKFQQRLTNRNSMIHATNVALIAIEDVDPAAEDLPARLSMRGLRAAATVEDILPTNEDDLHMELSFRALVAELIVLYCPGSDSWEDRAKMLEEIEKMMPKDRPLDMTKKTDARMFGVFDVNEGSKKGLIELFDQIRERSTLSKTEWASKNRIIQGDWLSTNNFRNARRIRRDDINAYERMEYGEDLTALFHHALQASHMIMRVHYGHAVRDPMSLAAHKGLLHRTWDVNKPNYAASKSLIRHSLIARMLHCVMAKKGFRLISELKKWCPTMDEIKSLCIILVDEFATTAAAERAKRANDDFYAHSVYFNRDALFFCKFEKSVSIADAGGVMRVLKYWTLAFRGAGQHNYARECAELLIRTKYELPDALRLAREKAWFVNRWPGKYGRCIAADLFLEQQNFWVKRVFIAGGNGVTIEYIMMKGSACVEAFREVSHAVANYFGDPDRARRHKEVKFHEDIRLLIEEMVRIKAHKIAPGGNFVPAPPKKSKKGANENALPVTANQRSAVIDAIVEGAQQWQGSFMEYIRSTTWDPQHGYPLATADSSQDTRLTTGTAFDSDELPFTLDSYDDLHGDENENAGLGAGALGGGDEFSGGSEDA